MSHPLDRRRLPLAAIACLVALAATPVEAQQRAEPPARAAAPADPASAPPQATTLRFPGADVRMARTRSLGLQGPVGGFGAPIRLDLARPAAGPHRLALLSPIRVETDTAGWSVARFRYGPRTLTASDPRAEVEVRVQLPPGRRALLDCIVERPSHVQFQRYRSSVTEVEVHDGVATLLLLGDDDGATQRWTVRGLLQGVAGPVANGDWGFRGCEIVPIES